MDEHEMCQNCKRDVPISNYKMHTLHCARNISKCDICQEPVNSSEMESHKKLVHSDEPCSECGEVVKVIQLEEHKENNCPKRKVICSFCEIDVKAEELESHEGYCGSRTEKCNECGDFVMLKDWVKHSEMRLYHELANKPCAEVFGQNESNTYTWTPITTFPSVTRGVTDYSWSPSILAGPCPLAFSTYTTTTPTFASHERRTSSASSTQQSSSSRLDSSIPDLETVSSRKSSISAHHRIPISSSPPTSASSFDFGSNEGHYQSPNGFDFSIPTEDSKEEEDILIPCEFCGVGINMYKLILHQTKCQENPESVKVNRTSSYNIPTTPVTSQILSTPRTPRLDDDLTTTSSASNGPIVSEFISMKDISSEPQSAPRRSSLRKDSIVEKYLTRPSTEINTSTNGHSSGARAKTTFKAFPPSNDQKDQEEEERERKRLIKRKVSAPTLTTRPYNGLISSKSNPDSEDLLHMNTIELSGRPSSNISSSKLDHLSTPLINQRKYSSASNRNGEKDDREDLRQLLESLRKDPFDDDLENNDGSFFPCEFCGDPYPVEYLMRHQLSCDLNPMPVSSGEGFNYNLIRNRIENNLNIE